MQFVCMQGMRMAVCLSAQGCLLGGDVGVAGAMEWFCAVHSHNVCATATYVTFASAIASANVC